MKVRELMWVAVLGASMSCGNGGGPKGDNNGWKLGDDASTGSDAGERDSGGSDGGVVDVGFRDDGTDAGPPPTSRVTFKLTNGHSDPVFAYQGVSGGLACFDGAWLEVVQNGVSQRITSDCTRCSCDDAPDCAVCALDCAPGANPDYAQLSVGESRTFEWDGLLRVDEQHEGGGQCEGLQPPTSDVLTARFCWGHSFELTSGPFGDVGEIECSEVQFAPTDSVVEHVIAPTARSAVTFRLMNASATSKFARFSPGGFCDFGSWLHLSQEQGLRFTSQCGNCSCTEVNDESRCPEACPGVACAPPTAELYEMAPGALREFAWNRAAYIDDTVDGVACEWDRLITGPVTASMCWGDGIDPDSFQLLNETCETVEFDPYTTNLVSHDIAN